jgi:hypothetical protein
MAETPLAQVGLLAVAVKRTGDTTVVALLGLDTETLPANAKLESRSVADRARTTPVLGKQ